MSAFRNHRRTAETIIDLLPPERPSRVARTSPVRTSVTDVADAQFVTVAKNIPTAGAKSWCNDNHNNRPLSSASRKRSSSSSSALASRVVRGIEGVLGRLSDRNFAFLVALVFGAVFTAAGLFASPERASPIRAVALDITHVTLTPQDANGMQVLLVNAIIENHGPGQRSMPRVRADLLSGGQVVASTFIDTPTGSIGAGESRGLAARLRHPGGKLPELRLSFADEDARSI
ncbi:hypothetical protein [Ciceribacter azotifigens]|uniref:hypothetical protein n=1 Tax=Ciceribacter azotifigens TaxID=2069303 RepID=UPI003A8B5640